jgi:hypothetical protein
LKIQEQETLFTSEVFRITDHNSFEN